MGQELVWESGLGSGASSSDDSDWETGGGGGGGAVGTVRHRSRLRHGRSAALSRLKPRLGARRLTACCPDLLRSHADRPPPPSPPPPLPPLPVLRSAGVQPAGGAAEDRSPPPSGAPAAHQDGGAADGCDSRLSGVVNGESAADQTAAGPGEAATDGDGPGRPLAALKTVIDDGLRPEPDRTGDGLEDVSADEGVEDDRTSPDCLPERVESPLAQSLPASVPAAGVGRHTSLDDVSDDETPSDNGIDHAVDAAAVDDSAPGENGTHEDPAPGDTERCSHGDGGDGDGEGAATGEVTATRGEEEGESSAAEQPSSSAVGECEAEDSEVTSSAPPEAEESSDVHSADPNTAAVAVEAVLDAKEEGADEGTDVEDEPSEADALQDREIDSQREVEDRSSNQRLAEAGAGECETLSPHQANPTDGVTGNDPTAGDSDSVSGDDSPDESHRAGDGRAAREDILPGHECVSDSGEDDPAVVDGSPGQTDAVGHPKPGRRVAFDPLASPVYSPVESPTSIHSLDSVESSDRPAAAESAETAPGGHCGLGVADASDVSSDEELVCGEAGQPPADSAPEAEQQGAGSWQPLPVESISSPESFGPDQEEPEEQEPEPEPELTPAPAPPEAELEPEPEVLPAETAAPAVVAEAADSTAGPTPAPAPAPAPAPLLCLGTEQISDNEEDGFDDGMEEGEIPSERPPTPPPPPAPPVVLPPPVPLPMPEPDLQRPLDTVDVYADSDLPEGDFEEGEIPSDPPVEEPEPPEPAEESPAPEATSPPPAAAQVPLSPADEPPPDGDYEEGEIVEELPASTDEPADDVAESPSPPPRPASGGEGPAGDVSREDLSPIVRPPPPAAGLQPTTIDDDDAPDVDEEVRDFVVSEKTITELERDDGDDVGWKKFSRSTRDRNYRDGKPAGRAAVRAKEVGDRRQESRRSPTGDGGRRGKKRDIQRYDVRKVITERKMRAQENHERGWRPGATFTLVQFVGLALAAASRTEVAALPLAQPVAVAGAPAPRAPPPIPGETITAAPGSLPPLASPPLSLAPFAVPFTTTA